MIRINLLPVRAAKKKESLRFQLTVAGLVTFLVVVLSVAAYLTVSGEASTLQSEIDNGNQELTVLRKKIGELAKIKEQKRVVEEKLKVIRNLEMARTGPSKLFRNVADAVPEKAWLVTIKDSGNLVTLTGFAATDEVVADFMRGLARHPELGRVELEVAQRAVEKETGTDVVSFIIRLESGGGGR